MEKAQRKIYSQDDDIAKICFCMLLIYPQILDSETVDEQSGYIRKRPGKSGAIQRRPETSAYRLFCLQSVTPH